MAHLKCVQDTFTLVPSRKEPYVYVWVVLSRTATLRLDAELRRAMGNEL